VLEEVSNSRQETTAFFFKIQREEKRSGWDIYMPKDTLKIIIKLLLIKLRI
jgi:hypothetical protein